MREQRVQLRQVHRVQPQVQRVQPQVQRMRQAC
jgi:hypothetical protein